MADGRRGDAMDVAVVGAGPTGLVTAIAMARRGHRVTVLDADPGPAAGRWDRRGVMQFHQPHFFRSQALELLHAEVPELLPALLEREAEPTAPPVGPGAATGRPVGPVPRGASLRVRRETVEAELRRIAVREPGVTTLRGRVDRVLSARGRATGVAVGDRRLDADLVVAATGRAGRLTERRRAPGESADCGLAYVSRQYRLRPGAEPGPTNSRIGATGHHDGYAAMVLRHEAGTFSTLIVRPTLEPALAGLRHDAAWDAVARAVPLLAAWTDPSRAAPLSPVMPTGPLRNTYRGQLDERGRVPLPGLVVVGDGVCTTNPRTGRGFVTSLWQVERLLFLLGEHRRDHAALTLALDAWCHEHVRPWFLDQAADDAAQQRRWERRDVDPTATPTSDLAVLAAAADPSLREVVVPYLAMRTPPRSLTATHARVRAVYASGWRPRTTPGPSREELVALVTAASPARPSALV